MTAVKYWINMKKVVRERYFACKWHYLNKEWPGTFQQVFAEPSGRTYIHGSAWPRTKLPIANKRWNVHSWQDIKSSLVLGDKHLLIIKKTSLSFDRCFDLSVCVTCKLIALSIIIIIMGTEKKFQLSWCSFLRSRKAASFVGLTSSCRHLPLRVLFYIIFLTDIGKFCLPPCADFAEIIHSTHVKYDNASR